MPMSTQVRVATVVAAGPAPVRADEPWPQPESATSPAPDSQREGAASLRGIGARFTRLASAGLAAALGLRVGRRHIRFRPWHGARRPTANARDHHGDADDGNEDDEEYRSEERFNHAAQ